MRRLLIGSASALLAAANAGAQTFLLSDDGKGAAKAYLACVEAEGTKLEPAGEAIAETVMAATNACASEKQQVALAVFRDVKNELSSSPSRDQIDVAKGLRETVEAQVIDEAKLRLMRLRAARSSTVSK